MVFVDRLDSTYFCVSKVCCLAFWDSIWRAIARSMSGLCRQIGLYLLLCIKGIHVLSSFLRFHIESYCQIHEWSFRQSGLYLTLCIKGMLSSFLRFHIESYSQVHEWSFLTGWTGFFCVSIVCCLAFWDSISRAIARSMSGLCRQVGLYLLLCIKGLLSSFLRFHIESYCQVCKFLLQFVPFFFFSKYLQ